MLPGAPGIATRNKEATRSNGDQTTCEASRTGVWSAKARLVVERVI